MDDFASRPFMAVALLLTFTGLAVLAFAMRRHYGQIWRRPVGATRAALLRLGGAAMLLASYVAAVLGWGFSIGLVAWIGCVSVGGLAVIFLLAYAPRAMPFLAMGCALGAVILAALALA